MTKEQSLVVAHQIWLVIAEDMSIPMSWGLDIWKMKVIEGGVEFNVNGFIHTGLARVILNQATDYYEITLINEDGSEKETIKDVSISELTATLDSHIENTGEDYDERVRTYLKEEAV